MGLKESNQIIQNFKYSDRLVWSNSINQDQPAPYRAVWSWITLFTIPILHFTNFIRQSNGLVQVLGYSKTCLKQPLKKKTNFFFQDPLSLNAGQKYCRMLQGKHSAILSTFIKLPFDIKIFVLSFFEWPLKTGFTVVLSYTYSSIALDTRLLAQAYRPSQIELSSPGIQKSCGGLIRGLIPGLIFFCPALPSSWSRTGEKKHGISAKQL